MPLLAIHAFRRLVCAWLFAATSFGASADQAMIHDQVVIQPQSINGMVVQELSGLAWDADEKLLYAVSDRGVLFHFKITLDGNRLGEVKLVHAVALMTPGAAKSKRANAEGLAVIDADNGKPGDTQLVVALENGPSLVRFDLQGRALGVVPLPEPLRDPAAYRAGNRLESVGVHARHGFVTAPQTPLKSQPVDVHRLYAMDGRSWTVPASADGSIKAIEVLADGTLLVLERGGRGKRALPLIRRLDPAKCETSTGCRTGPTATFDGLATGDNYEGLAMLSPRLFLMVSDDGGNAKRPTRLVLFGLEPWRP